jgi:D-3-phosphoglycerate dehydrogenase
MFTVLVTDHPGPTTTVEELLLKAVGGRLVVATTGDEPELLSLVPDADAILTCFRPVSASVIRAGSNLRVIGRYGVGVDNIAVAAATERGIPVTNVPAYCVDEVAEHTIAMLLALARGITRYDAEVRAGAWEMAVAAPLRRVAGRTLGIVGFGLIGRAVAFRALGLRMHILVADRSARRDEVTAQGASLTDLEDLLRRSDVVTLHVPLTRDTHHLLDAGRIGLMRPGSVLINCARGAIVDLDSLAEALREGRLAGAGLDVFEPERLPIDHRLMTLKNTILTPHVAFYSEESITELQTKATQNVIAVLTGHRPTGFVNAKGLR